MAEKKIEDELKKDNQEIQKIEEELQLNIAGRLARDFLKNPLTPVIAFVLFLFGAIALMMTPREENPQIDVPSANVIVVYPGASAKEVQNIVVEPLSRKLNAMTNVDHIYGMSMNSVGVVTVVFEIGQNKEKSISKLYDRVMQNMNLLPKGAWQPLVKPIDIDENWTPQWEINYTFKINKTGYWQLWFLLYKDKKPPLPESINNDYSKTNATSRILEAIDEKILSLKLNIHVNGEA
jgi:hypothetical protein